MSKRNKELAEKFRGRPCVVCDDLRTSGDHILNYKRWEHRDAQWNLWSLCFLHHHEKTHYGLERFVSKYGLTPQITRLGFKKCEYTQRWTHENDR